MSMHDNPDRQDQIREQAMRQWEEEQAREQEDLTRPAMVSSSASKDVGAKVAKGAFLGAGWICIGLEFCAPERRRSQATASGKSASQAIGTQLD
jgi:hypothetical protein